MSRVPSKSFKTLRRAAVFTVLSLAAASPALAQGANNSNPAPPPATPGSVNPGNTQVTAGATCNQQFNNHGVALAQTSQDFAIAGAAADGLGLAAEGVASVIPLSGSAASAIGIAAQGAALVTTSLGLANEQLSIDLTDTINNLPFCDQAFTGTISVSNGGANITGDSIFNSDLGVVGDVDVGGAVDASQVRATQGISAHGGDIWLGDPNGTSYSDGITLGGGAHCQAQVQADHRPLPATLQRLQSAMAPVRPTLTGPHWAQARMRAAFAALP